MKIAFRDILTYVGLLITLFFGGVILCFSYQGSSDKAQWLRDASLNFGTGLIGSVILIFIYDIAQKKLDDINKQKRLATGVRQLSASMQWFYMGYFSFLFQEGLTYKDVRVYHSYDEMFGDAFFDRVGKIDLYSVCYFNPDNPIWLQHFYDFCKSAREESTRLLTLYEPYFDDEIVALINNLGNSDFLITSSVLLSQLSKNMISPPIYPTEEMITALRNDLKSFIKITRYCNKHLQDSANYYTRMTWFVNLSP
jgi:hypothetical protein